MLLPLRVKHPCEIALIKKENVVSRGLLGPPDHCMPLHGLGNMTLQLLLEAGKRRKFSMLCPLKFYLSSLSIERN